VYCKNDLVALAAKILRRLDSNPLLHISWHLDFELNVIVHGLDLLPIRHNISTIIVPIASRTFSVQLGTMTSEVRTQYKLMIPVELKQKLEQAAALNNRSLSGEVIARLEQTFSVGKRLSDLEQDTESADYNIGDLNNRLEALEARVGDLEGSNNLEFDGT
jgi:Arc-like DNA binding domain